MSIDGGSSRRHFIKVASAAGLALGAWTSRFIPELAHLSGAKAAAPSVATEHPLSRFNPVRQVKLEGAALNSTLTKVSNGADVRAVGQAFGFSPAALKEGHAVQEIDAKLGILTIAIWKRDARRSYI